MTLPLEINMKDGGKAFCNKIGDGLWSVVVKYPSNKPTEHYIMRKAKYYEYLLENGVPAEHASQKAEL